jgi:hypothetical protein
MPDSDVTLAVIVPVVTPALFCALGMVDVAGLWREARPQTRLWRAQVPPRLRSWQTTQLPDAHSGRF